MDLTLQGYVLTNVDRRNILLGKNGCGKSYLLKRLEEGLRQREGAGVVKYLSPERGGLLQYEAGVEQNVAQDPNWLSNSRRRNRADQFRQQSAAQFRRLEVLALREIESNPMVRQDLSITFDKIIDQINTLLDRVYIARADPTFRILDRKSNVSVSADDISSGESELISLGIECLMFVRECENGKTNWLLIDEPDVHLHPDLQARFAAFLDTLLKEKAFSLLIATHSTAFLGAMRTNEETRLCFMKESQRKLDFRRIDDVYRKVLPVFGAHPLSNVFNQSPVLLVEGEDDERIWQQAVRSSAGRLQFFPCSVDSVTNLNDFENQVAMILESVYDDAIGFSLRDGDGISEPINDVGPVRRMRLKWHSAENLLLTDDVLKSCNVTWVELQSRIKAWLAGNAQHPHYAAMKAFADSGYDRAAADVKEIRNDLVGLLGTNKPWEILVGQQIGKLEVTVANSTCCSLPTALGAKVVKTLLTRNR